ncbi:MAG TPA: aminotransferase class V-fold PLP-dependent enzyme [Candidatus Limnocylindrales bacterium]|jgi:kynureninase|nr:aminotransferase class V-fold PLP-dependent enzyme [Candidatus Limnocylindrales bacterium]
MTDTLLRFRSEFPILERTTYMISNSLGAMPRGVYESAKAYCDIWASRGVRAWEEEWWTMAQEVGDAIGAIMNAPSGTVSLQLNVTSCQAVIASCFDFSGRRNKIVYSDMNFPSIMYFWEAQRARGARVHMVKTDDGVHVPTERILDAIDEETLLVPISHVVFRSSYIKELQPIIEKAHRVGALVVVDAFQSLGNVPLNVQALNADFAVGGVLKWLCGGAGTSYLYVRPDLAKKLQPTITGWFAHENPFDFEIGPTRYAEQPFRFMQGTSNVPGFYTAMPGLKIIREAGVENIRAKSKIMTARLIELADQRGWRVNAPRDAERRGGTVAIDMPNAKEVCAELLRRDVLVDFRPKAGVRFSPHFYNTLEEIDRAIQTVDQILSTMGVAAGAR